MVGRVFGVGCCFECVSSVLLFDDGGGGLQRFMTYVHSTLSQVNLRVGDGLRMRTAGSGKGLKGEPVSFVNCEFCQSYAALHSDVYLEVAQEVQGMQGGRVLGKRSTEDMVDCCN